MAFSKDLLSQRNQLEHEILALERTLGDGSNAANLLSSDSDSAEELDDSGHAGEDGAHEDLEAERQQIQREIEELERKLGADAALVDAVTDSEQGSLTDSDGEDSDNDLDLPQDLETCLQMNLVYQEVLKEKLAELERLLNENREQQKELEEQLTGPSYINPGLPHLKLFLGSFMKPYFKDKLTGLGPPANEESKERMAHGTKPCNEMKIRRWEAWQKALLINSVVTDTMKRMLLPKLSKMEYITTKMCKAEAAGKEELQNQITRLEKDIAAIRSMKEDQLYGNRHDDHDWDKISNIDFEGQRQPDDLMRFWQNYLHPSINKSTWDQDEIAKLADVAEEHGWRQWENIAESLGTGRTAFMCFQTYQRYIAKQFRKREWTKQEDKIFRELVDKMRIGNFIPYTQISYFMEGRDSAQLSYRWTCVLDPSLKKGPWTKEEDGLLLNAVKKYGCKEWWKIRLEVPGRTDNSCRDRYLDCLRDDIKRGAWSFEEVELLKKLVVKHGVGKWSKIASEIPNRVDSQCLNKWKWMMQKADGEGVKRKKRRNRSAKSLLRSKRRRVRLGTETKKEKDDFYTESDTSEDENQQVLYMDSDAEPTVENVSSDEESELEYIQPDMKEWIPARGNKLAHSPGTLRTLLVRLPTEAEECAEGLVRNTVLDKMGNPVKTYVGMEPPALQKWNSSNAQAMIMVSESDVKRLLVSMSASIVQARKTKNKTSVSSRTNQNCAKNDEKQDKSDLESSQKNCKPVRKPVNTTRLSYDLMLAITPWIGNVVMPLPFSERQVCEADIVRKRAADVTLVKSSVFMVFLQALKVDVDGCKKVIEARKGKVSLTSGPNFRSYSARKPTPGSYRYIRTVADILAEHAENEEHSRTLQSSVFIELLLLPQPAKTAIPSRPQQQRKTKQEMQSASQKINATVMRPQTFVVAQPNTDNKVGSSHNVVQELLPLLQLGAQDASKISQPESERVTQPAPCPTTSASTTGPPTVTSEEVSTSKRRHKPTMKAQALMDDKRTKLSKKQAAQKQQKSSVTQTVAVPPQTSAWILTPAGLMPVSEIQVQPPGDPGHQNQVMPNNVQIVFQPPVIVNQSSCVAPTNGMRQSKPATELPGNNNISLTTGSKLGQNHRPPPVSDSHIVSSLPSSSNFPNVISADVTKIPSVPQLLSDNKMPTSVTVSTAQVPPSKTACNQNKPVTPMNPLSSLVPVSSSPVGTSENLTPSSISDATNNVPNVSSVSAVTSTPSSPSVHPVNISGPGTITGSQSQRMSHPVSQMEFQKPIIINQNVSLKLINTAGPCQPNPPPATTANIARVPTNSGALNSNKTLPTSNEGSLAVIDTAGPCLIKNAPPTAVANITRVPPNTNKSHPKSSNEASLALINATGLCLIENSSTTATAARVPPNSAAPNIKKSHPTSSTEGPVISSYFLTPNSVPPSSLNVTSHAIPPSILVNSPVGVNVGGLQNDELCINLPISPMTTSQILPQSVAQQMTLQAKKPTVWEADTTFNPPAKQMTIDPSLMFFEQPAEVKDWLKGNDGISLPGLKEKMPYLPPFVSSINTLTTLLEGRDSLLKSAVQLLPEELRDCSEEETKIAAVRKMVSERFKTNQAYLLLKARFLSCFTLPAVLATINPCRESKDALDEENNMDKVEPKQFGGDHLW